MKTYLQRLAQRAEGVSLTPSLNPTIRREGIREAGSGSLFEAADEPFPEMSKASEDVPRNQPLHSGKEVEPLAPVLVGIGDGVRISRANSSDLVETRPGPATIRQSGLEGDETASSPHLEPRREIVFPEKSIDRKRSAGGKRQPQRHAQPANLARKSLAARPQPQVDETPRRERPGHTEERRPDQLGQDVPQELLSPLQSIDRLNTAPGETIAVANDDAVRNLEPSPAEPTPATPISEGPRLVIGQLRVDIVPTGPTATREVVRVVQRSAGAGRTSRTGPVSKLRFGLGQM